MSRNLTMSALQHCVAGRAWWIAMVMGLLLCLSRLEAQEETNRWVKVDDFEGAFKGWTFVDGDELPKAKGVIVLDSNVPHQGTNSLRMDADFKSGGAYVSVWKDLESLELSDFSEIHLWIKARNLALIGIRLVDHTGQYHQKSNAVALSEIEEWHEVVLKVSDLVGGEHWGGANDGKWHGPAKSIGFEVGKGALADPEEKAACLWLDEIQVLPVPLGAQTMLACVPMPAVVKPGVGARMMYRWEATPLGRDYSVRTRFVGEDGKVAFSRDHKPPVSTRDWSGLVAYTNLLLVPDKLPEGEYRIVIDLYDPASASGEKVRPTIKCGPGIQAVGKDETVVLAGVLNISTNATLIAQPKPTLNLKGYRMTFNEDFKNGLDVSSRGPGTRWIAHTPYRSDFGEASFADPQKAFPFLITNGVLRIEARKHTNFGNIGRMWRSGMLSSVDSKGVGFAQRLGYFEIRAKLSLGTGVWPSCMLMGVEPLRNPGLNKNKPLPEIDFMENFGNAPYILRTTVHLWDKDDDHYAVGGSSFQVGMADDFHNYGVLLDEDNIVFYFDGVEVRRQKMLPEVKTPLYLMVALALGGGQSLEETPSPSYLYIEHIRAYARDKDALEAQ